MIDVQPFLSFNIAVILLLVGKAITLRSSMLRRYSIPEPVVGGVLCAAVVAAIYFLWDRQIRFQLEVRDFLLLVFFAGIGLKSDIRTLLRGGRPLVVLLVLATIFIVAQNAVGMTVASLFGLPPLAGLLAGSVALTGGVGTTVAWVPIFVEELGIANAMELGLASNTVGMIAACVVGGPMAAFLLRRHGIETSSSSRLDLGAVHDRPPPLDYFGVLWAILVINVTIMLGTGLDALVAQTGLILPTFVSCLIAGIIVGNVSPLLFSRRLPRDRPGIARGLALISDIALGLFLTMALMALQLWELANVLGFIVTVLTIQIALTVVFTILMVFRAMGRDYEAAVISAGFGGIALGSTATAIANMTAVTQQHGAAHRAFIVVPLVCGFFIDIVNALVISAFVS